MEADQVNISVQNPIEQLSINEPEESTDGTGTDTAEARVLIEKFLAAEITDEDKTSLQWQSNIIDGDEIVYAQKAPMKLISDYYVGQTLGEGSYSKVREAIHKDTLEKAAVKIMSHQRLRKIPNGILNASNEIDILRLINHENVIKLLHVHRREEPNPKMYLFLEYGVVVLQKLIEDAPNGHLPVWQAHNYFSQLLNGLEYLHSRRIIHNDIKPGNLMLNAQETLKIIDFGVSVRLELFAEDDMCMNSLGSPAFQPPEVVLGNRPFHGFKIDVWAIGVCLFNFVFGIYPYEGPNIYVLFDKIASDPLIIPPLPRGANSDSYESLKNLLKALMNKDVSQRITVSAAKNHEWMHFKHVRTEPKVGIPLNSVRRSPMLGSMVTTVPHLINDMHTVEQEIVKLNYRNEPKLDRLSKLFQNPNIPSREDEHHERWKCRLVSTLPITLTQMDENSPRHSRMRRAMGRRVWQTTVNVLNRLKLI